MGRDNLAVKRGQSTLEYGFIIAFVVASFLIMQNYLKRSMQGQMRTTGDALTEEYFPSYSQRRGPYAARLTEGIENDSSRSISFEVTTAGLNNPTTITWTKGSYSSGTKRNIRRLEESWP